MSEPEQHSKCRDTIQAYADTIVATDDGLEVDVTAVDPCDPDLKPFGCPHGVRYWLVPVSRRVAS